MAKGINANALQWYSKRIKSPQMVCMEMLLNM